MACSHPADAPTTRGETSMAVRTTPSETATTRGSLVDRFSVVLVAVAATLWASDTYFRAQLNGHL
jgi:hypothetical protein